MGINNPFLGFTSTVRVIGIIVFYITFVIPFDKPITAHLSSTYRTFEFGNGNPALQLLGPIRPTFFKFLALTQA